MTKIARAKRRNKRIYGGYNRCKNKSVLGACVLGVGGDEIINGFTNLMYAKKAYTIF
jgi:hypothetical protein